MAKFIYETSCQAGWMCLGILVLGALTTGWISVGMMQIALVGVIIAPILALIFKKSAYLDYAKEEREEEREERKADREEVKELLIKKEITEERVEPPLKTEPSLDLKSDLIQFNSFKESSLARIQHRAEIIEKYHLSPEQFDGLVADSNLSASKKGGPWDGS